MDLFCFRFLVPSGFKYLFFFSRLGKFSTTIFFLNKFCIPFSLISFWDPYNTNASIFLSQKSLKLPSFSNILFFFFFLFSLGDFHYSISNSLIHLFVLSNLLFIPFMHFKISIIIVFRYVLFLFIFSTCQISPCINPFFS